MESLGITGKSWKYDKLGEIAFLGGNCMADGQIAGLYSRSRDCAAGWHLAKIREKRENEKSGQIGEIE